MIFQAGFSTAETVTNLSGRGVGMDVLNSAMKELRGRISISSQRGQGSTVVLAIPQTLAFLDSLVMRVGARLYATPIDVVAEIFRPGTEQITRVSAADGAEMVRVRDALIPICRLQTYYGEPASDMTPLEKLIIVVFNTSAGQIGLPDRRDFRPAAGGDETSARTIAEDPRQLRLRPSGLGRRRHRDRLRTARRKTAGVMAELALVEKFGDLGLRAHPLVAERAMRHSLRRKEEGAAGPAIGPCARTFQHRQSRRSRRST